ncbi:MAG TPA: acyl-CoA synthetase [Acidimicrobiales bacterium]|nr:acyl-CoA synthetase [Acidimicrobiales bacterium]
MYLGDRAEAHPDRVALRMEDSDESMSYAELEAASNRFAHALAALGAQPGDVVAVMLDNCLEFGVAWWGTIRSGMYLTTINWHLAAGEVEYILENSEAKVVVTGPSTAEAAQRACRRLPHVVAVQVGLGSERGPVRDFATLLADQPETRLPVELAGAPMFYSSGTTGRPKGIKARLTGRHPREVPSVAYWMVSQFGMRDGDRYLNPAPLYHGAPASFTFGAQAIGATSVIMRRFDAERALALIDSQKITISQWVPTMFQRLLRLDGATKARYDLSSMRLAVHAAAPCPPSVKKAMIDWWGPILLEYYGATECGATVITSEEWLSRPGSVGRPWGAGTRMTILDVQSREPVDQGAEGLVYFDPLDAHRIEYYKDPERTAGIYHDGMVTAGDIGFVDEDGYLYLTDRLSNMIISGGVNIYPQEIEHCLIEHPAVLDVAVFGIPDEEFGEQVKAVVQPAPGAAPGPELAEELRQHCRRRLAHFKVPRTIDFAEQMPRDDNGKLYKRRLRDAYWEGHQTSII